MRLLGIMAVEEDRKVLHSILAGQKVEVFSELAMTGFERAVPHHIGWWSKIQESETPSTLVLLIAPAETVQEILEAISRANQGTVTRPIHAFTTVLESFF